MACLLRLNREIGRADLRRIGGDVRPAMKFLLLLLRSNARLLMLALPVSILSGASGAGLIALVHHVWQEQLFTSTFWLASFLGVLVILIASSVAAQLMVLNLSLKAVADLRMELCSRILSTPLRRLEELGHPRLLAVLTDDVSMIAAVLRDTPRLVINVTTLLAGGLYMAWLSWTAFAVIATLLLLGIGGYRLLWGRAVGYIWRAREVYDDLFRNFRALHDGIKQLKLNRERRRIYLSGDLQNSLDSYRRLQATGRALLVGAESVTRLVFFAVLAVLIFAIPRLDGMRIEILSGFVLMALYLYRPLGVILELVPEFGRARVALQKIDDLELSLSHDAPSASTEDPRGAAPTWQRLGLSGATYTYRREYDDDVFTMGPLDLTLHPGEVVFVTGGNGSGEDHLRQDPYQPPSPGHG